MDMSTIGVLDEFMGTILSSLRSADTSNLLTPGVSSISFGGEISISFTQGSTIIGALQNSIPTISNGYANVAGSLRSTMKRYQRLFNFELRKRFF